MRTPSLLNHVIRLYLVYIFLLVIGQDCRAVQALSSPWLEKAAKYMPPFYLVTQPPRGLVLIGILRRLSRREWPWFVLWWKLGRADCKGFFFSRGFSAVGIWYCTKTPVIIQITKCWYRTLWRPLWVQLHPCHHPICSWLMFYDIMTTFARLSSFVVNEVQPSSLIGQRCCPLIDGDAILYNTRKRSWLTQNWRIRKS